MNEYQNLMDSVRATVNSLKKFTDKALEQYMELVNQVLAGQITDEKHIEQIMDGLLDFSDDERFIEIYRKLCRHIYEQHPQMVGEHEALFRMQFEIRDDEGIPQQEVPQGDMTM